MLLPLFGAALLFNGVCAFNQTVFTLATAERQVRFCGAAYCTDPSFKNGKVQEWTCNACKSSPHVEAKVFNGETADANGFVGYEKLADEIIVAFSGTDAVSEKNWIEDVDFPLIDFPHCQGCKVHNGFYITYLSISKEIKSLISGFLALHPTAKITVTGHSLGAALATIAIADLSSDKTFLPSMATNGQFLFGSPRVGNKPFADWYSSKAPLTFRVVHNRDPVSLVPFQKMGFHHVPYEVSDTCPSTKKLIYRHFFS